MEGFLLMNNRLQRNGKYGKTQIIKICMLRESYNIELLALEASLVLLEKRVDFIKKMEMKSPSELK